MPSEQLSFTYQSKRSSSKIFCGRIFTWTFQKRTKSSNDLTYIGTEFILGMHKKTDISRLGRSLANLVTSGTLYNSRE